MQAIGAAPGPAPHAPEQQPCRVFTALAAAGIIVARRTVHPAARAPNPRRPPAHPTRVGEHYDRTVPRDGFVGGGARGGGGLRSRDPRPGRQAAKAVYEGAGWTTRGPGVHQRPGGRRAAGASGVACVVSTACCTRRPPSPPPSPDAAAAVAPREALLLIVEWLVRARTNAARGASVRSSPCCAHTRASGTTRRASVRRSSQARWLSQPRAAAPTQFGVGKRACDGWRVPGARGSGSKLNLGSAFVCVFGVVPRCAARL
jgi:hypothetical protein